MEARRKCFRKWNGGWEVKKRYREVAVGNVQVVGMLIRAASDK